METRSQTCDELREEIKKLQLTGLINRKHAEANQETFEALKKEYHTIHGQAEKIKEENEKLKEAAGGMATILVKLKDKIEELEEYLVIAHRENKDLKEENKDLRYEVSAIPPSVPPLQDEIAALKLENKKLKEELASANECVDESCRAAHDWEDSFDEAQDEIKKLQEEIKSAKNLQEFAEEFAQLACADLQHELDIEHTRYVEAGTKRADTMFAVAQEIDPEFEYQGGEEELLGMVKKLKEGKEYTKLKTEVEEWKAEIHKLGGLAADMVSHCGFLLQASEECGKCGQVFVDKVGGEKLDGGMGCRDCCPDEE